MKISLVLATKGHKGEDVGRFLRSLSGSNTDLYEVLIISQDTKGYYESILAGYSGLPIKLLYSEDGLSKARNVGLRHAAGDLVCFPDDDCVYNPFFIEDIVAFFNGHKEVDILTVDVYDLQGSVKLPFVDVKSSGELVYRDIFKGVSSVSIFHRVVEDFYFDEKFGLGADYKSSEEFDYVFRLMEMGRTLFYSSSFFVRHPNMRDLARVNLQRKVSNNSIGHGAYFRKHFNPLWRQSLCFLLIKPIGGAIVRTFQFRFMEAGLYIRSMMSRIKGFLVYRQNLD